MAKLPTFSDEEHAEFATAIDDGSFFTQGRRWYDVVYMSVMSDRCFYIVLMILAVITAFFAVIALIQLTPIKPATPVLFPMENVFRDAPNIRPLRHSHDQPVDDALQRFFISQYVEKREHYSFDSIQAQYRFLRSYSTDDVTRAYKRMIDPTSPRSPINQYQKRGKRSIDIDSITIRRSDNEPFETYEDTDYIAEVRFEAKVTGARKKELSRWRSTVVFHYKPIGLTQPEDQRNGRLKIDPMTFTVKDYTVVEVMNTGKS